eukprot:TRINITY_DN1259_c0_g1_i2.p1 TRINITY_DN1259_c0_g1~~TRINITY_DN1259_c0_g1_i2.p1  ORF type:complete len:254 (-),score=47.78 TRINITY_DN1259_c0_g1_i2:35-796(-)
MSFLASLSRRVLSSSHRLSSSRSLILPASRGFHTSSPTRSDALSQHVNEAHNNSALPFDFTDENYEEAKRIMAKYPPQYKQSASIPLLDLAQRQVGGWLPISAMDKVAKILGIPPMSVYEVASFYTMFNRTKVGKFHVQVCCTTPCMIRGAYDVLSACEKHLGVETGHMTKDEMFTLSEVECLGACVNAPMMQINDDFYEDLTPETAVAVLDKLRKGEQPKVGPQIPNRRAADGPMGKTTLLEEPSGPYCRPL